MQRDFERDDPRRRHRTDDDPRDDPRERYGNEEDSRSREYRRAYAEQNLPRRMQDDRPYNRAGYEPEFGRPGARENVDLERDDPYREYRESERERQRERSRGTGGDPYGFDWEQPAGPRERPFYERTSRDERASREQGGSWQGGYYGQGQRWSGEPFDDGGARGRTPDRSAARYSDRDAGRDRRPDTGQPRRGERYGQPSYGRAASPDEAGQYQSSPYDAGDVSPWYGGDTGMGDPGSSQPGSQYGPASGGQYGSRSGGQYGSGSGGRYGGSGTAGGRFSGRGPRGYQRSDERIREDVCETLTHHGEIDASEIDVEVHGATVTLHGTVESGRIRRLSEEVVEDIPGVRDVRNEPRVNRRSGYGATGGGPSGGRIDDPMVDSGTFASDRGGLRESGTPAYGTGVASTSGVSTRSGPGEPGVSAGGGASQHGNRWQVRETMDVVGADGESIGTVKSVRGTDFELDRPMARDVYVPFSAVQTVDGERVLLRCRASEVDDQHWPEPSLTRSQEAPPAR